MFKPILVKKQQQVKFESLVAKFREVYDRSDAQQDYVSESLTNATLSPKDSSRLGGRKKTTIFVPK